MRLIYPVFALLLSPFFLTARNLVSPCAPPDTCIGGVAMSFSSPDALGYLDAQQLVLLPDCGEMLVVGTAIRASEEQDHLFVLKLSADGQVLLNRSLFFPAPTANGSCTLLLSSMFLTSDGFVVGCGFHFSCSGGTATNIIFKINPADLSLVWTTVVPTSNYVWWSDMMEDPATGNYLLVGSGGSGGGVFTYGNVTEVDRATGLCNGAISYGVNEISALLAAPDKGLWLAGDDDFDSAPLLIKTTADRQVEWAWKYVPTDQMNFLDINSLQRDQDALLMVGMGDLIGGGSGDLTYQLYKTDLAGNLLWAKDYAPTNASGMRGLAMTVLQDGYLLRGISPTTSSYTGRHCLVKTDFDGNVVWARSLRSSSIGFHGRELLHPNGDYYVLSTSENPDGKAYLFRFDPRMPVVDNCDLVEPLNLVVTDISFQQQPFITDTFISTDTWINTVPQTLVQTVTKTELCKAGCLQDYLSALNLSDTSICPGSTLALQLAGFDTFTWSPTTGLSCTDCPNPVFSAPVTPILYTLTADNGCFSQTDSFLLSPFPPTTFDLIQDSVTLRGCSAMLSIGPSQGLLSVNWSPAPDSCQGCPAVAVTPLETTTYTATITDLNGCTSTQMATVMVENPAALELPNAFTPDGDGLNDVFRVPPDKGLSKVIAFTIYNRWGQLVHEERDVLPNAHGWDGRVDGKAGVADVYVYRITLLGSCDKVLTLHGEVMLMR